MRCERARQILTRKASRNLTCREESELSDHLRSCPACAALEPEMERTWTALECYPTVEPSADFIMRLKARLRAVPSPPVVRTVWYRRPGLVWQGMALAAGLLLFAVLMFRNVPPRQPTLPDNPMAGNSAGPERSDEQFLEELEQALAQSGTDYLSTYDAWPGPAPAGAGQEPVKAKPGAGETRRRKETS